MQDQATTVRSNFVSVCSMTTMTLRRPADLATAARECGVIWAGMFALGIGFGVVVTDHGFPWWVAPLISGTMFAGSVEFILIGMFAASAPLVSIALTTFLVNSRHLFYGLSFPLQRVRGRAAKAYSVFGLVDEAFAVLSTKDPKSLTSGRILWTQIGMHTSWITGSLTGALVGARYLSGLEGLDFVLTALFIVLTMDAYRTRPDRTTLLVALSAATIALVLAPGSMILVAMSVFTAVMIARQRITRPLEAISA